MRCVINLTQLSINPMFTKFFKFPTSGGHVGRHSTENSINTPFCMPCQRRIKGFKFTPSYCLTFPVFVKVSGGFGTTSTQLVKANASTIFMQEHHVLVVL